MHANELLPIDVVNYYENNNLTIASSLNASKVKDHKIIKGLQFALLNANIKDHVVNDNYNQFNSLQNAEQLQNSASYQNRDVVNYLQDQQTVIAINLNASSFDNKYSTKIYDTQASGNLNYAKVACLNTDYVKQVNKNYCFIIAKQRGPPIIFYSKGNKFINYAILYRY